MSNESYIASKNRYVDIPISSMTLNPGYVTNSQKCRIYFSYDGNFNNSNNEEAFQSNEFVTGNPFFTRYLLPYIDSSKARPSLKTEWLMDVQSFNDNGGFTDGTSVKQNWGYVYLGSQSKIRIGPVYQNTNLGGAQYQYSGDFGTFTTIRISIQYLNNKGNWIGIPDEGNKPNTMVINASKYNLDNQIKYPNFTDVEFLEGVWLWVRCTAKNWSEALASFNPSSTSSRSYTGLYCGPVVNLWMSYSGTGGNQVIQSRIFNPDDLGSNAKSELTNQIVYNGAFSEKTPMHVNPYSAVQYPQWKAAWENTSGTYNDTTGQWSEAPYTDSGNAEWEGGSGGGGSGGGGGGGEGAPGSSTNPSKPGGGNGNYDDSFNNDKVEPEDADAIIDPFVSAGVNTYILTTEQMNEFHDYMYSTPFTDFWKSLDRTFGDAQNGIVNLLSVYSDGQSHVSGPSTIHVANHNTNVQANWTVSNFVNVDCGEVYVPEAWGGFLDYAPYTSASLYLPFCGTVDLPINEIMRAYVKINYVVHLLTGACVATVTVDKTDRNAVSEQYADTLNSVILRVSGNSSIPLPWTSVDNSRQWQALASLAVGAAAVTLTGGAAIATAAAPSIAAGASAVSSTASSFGAKLMSSAGVNVLSNPTEFFSQKIQRGGTAMSAYGVMQSKVPYLMITRPIQSYPENYAHYYGLPSNVTKQLGSLTGFTKVQSIVLDDLDGITPTEIDMLHQALTNGIYI